MEYEDRIVCFLDILGFKEHIGQTVSSNAVANRQKIAAIASALEEIRNALDIDRPIEESKRVTQFSDSVVISYQVTEPSSVFWMLLDVLWVLIALVERSMLCRGGLARGPLIHTERLLFGPAMNDAYRLENSAAIYPRVIVPKSIIALSGGYRAPHHRPEDEAAYVKSFLKRDADGMYYVDYFGSAAQSELNNSELDYAAHLQCLARLIERGLESTDPSIRIKYQWMREKYDRIGGTSQRGVAR